MLLDTKLLYIGHTGVSVLGSTKQYHLEQNTVGHPVTRYNVGYTITVQGVHSGAQGVMLSSHL